MEFLCMKSDLLYCSLKFNPQTYATALEIQYIFLVDQAKCIFIFIFLAQEFH